MFLYIYYYYIIRIDIWTIVCNKEFIIIETNSDNINNI